MSKKLFVGNLSFNVTQDGLKDLFASYGEVSEAVVIVNKFSNRSKGFGFVTFANDADADKAMSEMNGKEVDGRKLTVNEAKPFTPGERPRREGFGGRGGGFGGGGGRGRGGGGFGRGRPRREEGGEDY